MGLTLLWLETESKQGPHPGYSRHQTCANSVLPTTNRHPSGRSWGSRQASCPLSSWRQGRIWGFRKPLLEPLASEAHQAGCKLHPQDRSVPPCLTSPLKRGLNLSHTSPYLSDSTEMIQLPVCLRDVVLPF